MLLQSCLRLTSLRQLQLRSAVNNWLGLKKKNRSNPFPPRSKLFTSSLTRMKLVTLSRQQWSKFMEEEFPVEVDGHGRPDGKPNSFPRRVVFYSPPSWPKTEQRPAAKYFLEGRKFQTLSSVHNIETPDEIIDWPDNGYYQFSEVQWR